MNQLHDLVQTRVRSRLLGPTGRGRRLREQAGLTVRELARLLEVDGATLSRWERGEGQPKGDAGARWVSACTLIERELEKLGQPVESEAVAQ